MEYRKELKYNVTDNDLKIIYNRIKNVMKKDKNMFDDKFYNIRSIYFDDYDDYFFNQNDSGVDNRYKIRIRIYNKSYKLIKLEIKYKDNGLTKKESCSITKKLCDKIINNEMIDYKECKNNVLRKFYLEQRLHLLKPKIIVEYDRSAYVYDLGNVRVTFDKNIRCSNNIKLFFEDNINAIPILEKYNHVLEVKYDELLPDFIFDLLQLNKLEQTSFSKYYLSRLVYKEVGK